MSQHASKVLDSYTRFSRLKTTTWQHYVANEIFKSSVLNTVSRSVFILAIAEQYTSHFDYQSATWIKNSAGPEFIDSISFSFRPLSDSQISYTEVGLSCEKLFWQ